MKLFEKFLDVLYPNDISCIICGDDIFNDNLYCVCEKCKTNLPFIKGKVCKRCGLPINSMANYCDRCQRHQHSFDRAVATFYYRDEIARCIKELKFENCRYFAKHLAKFMADTYIENNFDCDVIVPVPMHINRLKERGFNHSELLAYHLSEFVQIPLDTQSLVKCVNTKTQVKLNYEQRQKNLINSFKVVNRKAIKGKNVLVVDDVFTTGSTMDNCAKALKSAGANKIFCISIAHTVIL